MEGSGAFAIWFDGCDAGVCKVSCSVDGLLLEQLASITGYTDPDCVEFFRQGAFPSRRRQVTILFARLAWQVHPLLASYPEAESVCQNQLKNCGRRMS